MTRLVRITFILVLLALISGSSPVSAQNTNGVIKGRLLNGSADNAPMTGIEVILLPVSPAGPGTRLSAMPGADGSFRFEGLNTEPTQSFVLWAEYSGSRFQLAPTQFEAGAREKTSDIIVYDPVEQDPGIIILRQSILILPAPASAQNSATIVELYELENPSKTAFIGSLLPAPPTQRTNIATPPSNRASIRLPLPSGAQNLTVLEGIQPNALIQTTDGVADSLPFVPGRKDVVIQYVLPYVDAIVLDKPAAYPTADLSVLLEDGNWGLDADGLVAQGTNELNGEKFQQYRGSQIGSGQPIRLVVRGPGLIAQPFEQQGLFTGIIVASIALIVIAGIAIPMARRRSSAAKTVKAAPVVPVVQERLAAGDREQERLDLIEMIADLDDRHDAGLIPAEEWERLRSAKKEALVRLLREVRGI